jgi:PAS domain S-box-containing protein
MISIMISLFFVPANADDPGLNTGIEISQTDLKLTPLEKSWLNDHPSIEIGGPQAFPPFHYFDEDGAKGISIDYIATIMNHLGIKVNVQNNLPWPEILKRIESGRIDLIPCIAKTDKRETFLNFSTPYLSFPLVIISRNDMPFMGGVEDLYNKKLATIRKISTADWLKKDGIGFIPYYVISPLKGLEAVSFGQADAHIENLAVASYLIQKHGLANLKIAAPTHYANYNLHMAVRKDLPELLGIINKALDAISPEHHGQIRNKWLSIRYEHGIQKTDVWRWVLSVAGVALLFVVFVLFGNKRLKREILEKKKAEDARKESKRKLSTLNDNLSGIAYRCLNDMDWTMLYLSNGCYALTGYEPFELIKNQTLSYGDLIIEADRQSTYDVIQDAIKKREAFAIEYRICDRNKNIKWIWEKGQGVFDKKGNLDSLEGFITDTTERKQAEEINKVLLAIASAVNTSQNLKALFGSIHNSLGRIMDVTNFYVAMVDLKERNLHFPYRVDTVDDDFSPISDFDVNDSLTGLVISQQRAVLLNRKDLEKRAGLAGLVGTMPLIWMGVPLIINNKVIGVVAVQSYIDANRYNEQDLQILSGVSDQIAIAIDRKRAEDALRESEKKFRHIFKNAPGAIYEIDFEKGKFINVNDIMCKYTGYSEKELFSMDPFDFLTKESKRRYIERFEKLSTGEQVDDAVEYRILKKNGQKLNVILNNDFVYKNGKLKTTRVVVHDITELKKAQKEKIRAQKIAGEHKKLALVGQVAGKMAHDFNNILGIIMGNTELSLMDCKDEDTKKTFELIFEQTQRGKNLTRNLVAFAKDQEPKQEFFKISEKIDLVLNLLKKDLQGIELIREDMAGVPDLLADAGMIEHAIINLTQNAIHATSKTEHPIIVIRTYCLDDVICFKIEDNGCGILKEHLENIYEPSFTLKGTRDKTNSYGSGIKGTGYGMANVKKYIEQHKGNISVKSEFDSGTEFTISLPILKKELTGEEKAEIRKEKIYFDKAILLVEDEPAISGVQYKILSQEPFHHKVDIANDGQAAMDLFDGNPYDLVSLDYLLPGAINGMDVYHHIRLTDQTIPILFISGNIEFLLKFPIKASCYQPE